MEGVVEDHHGGPPGGRAGVLDGVLQRLAAGVEQRGALLVVAGGDPVQRFGDLDVGLIRRGQEAGVGVSRQLCGRAGDDVGGGVADRGDRDAAAQVDEGVAVDIDEDPTAGRRRVHTALLVRPAGTADRRRAASSNDRGPGTSVTNRRAWCRCGPPTAVSTAVIPMCPSSRDSEIVRTPTAICPWPSWTTRSTPDGRVGDYPTENMIGTTAIQVGPTGMKAEMRPPPHRLPADVGNPGANSASRATPG